MCSASHPVRGAMTGRPMPWQSMTDIDQGQPGEAAAVLNELLKDRPTWLAAMLLRGLAAYIQGDLDAAGSIWDDASRRHPEEPRLETYRSMLARRRKELSDA